MRSVIFSWFLLVALGAVGSACGGTTHASGDGGSSEASGGSTGLRVCYPEASATADAGACSPSAFCRSEYWSSTRSCPDLPAACAASPTCDCLVQNVGANLGCSIRGICAVKSNGMLVVDCLPD